MSELVRKALGVFHCVMLSGPDLGCAPAPPRHTLPRRSGGPPIQSIPVLRVRSTLTAICDGAKLWAMTPLSTARHGPTHRGVAELPEERLDESAPSVRDLRNHREHFRPHLPRPLPRASRRDIWSAVTPCASESRSDPRTVWIGRCVASRPTQRGPCTARISGTKNVRSRDERPVSIRVLDGP